MAKIDLNNLPGNPVGRTLPVRNPQKQIATVKVVPTQQSYFRRFIGDKGVAVFQFILFDIIVPEAKNAVLYFVSEMLGIERPSTIRGGSKTRVSYEKMYRGDGDVHHVKPSQNRYDFSQIVFDTHQEAVEVLQRLTDIVDQYDVVSVADLFDMVGLENDYVDFKYGWTNLAKAGYRRAPYGYTLILPRPFTLE